MVRLTLALVGRGTSPGYAKSLAEGLSPSAHAESASSGGRGFVSRVLGIWASA